MGFLKKIMINDLNLCLCLLLSCLSVIKEFKAALNRIPTMQAKLCVPLSIFFKDVIFLVSTELRLFLWHVIFSL